MRPPGTDPSAAALGHPVGTLDVWPGCTHAVTRAEHAVLASPPFQRLRRLRQMGLAFHAWPNAENTRASHSLGVAYWSATYLAALRRSSDPGTGAALDAATASLDGLSLDVVLRLFGLLHDVDLLPLGHTLRYQSGLFGEPSGKPRLAACADAVKAHAAEHAFGDAATDAERRAWIDALDRHLDAATAARDGLAHARLAVEIVNSGLGADLIDFAVRDSFAIARPQALHVDLPEGLRLVDADGDFGLALDVGEAASAARRVAMADDLYRARFEVFAASVFHPVKLAADAMLDLALRRIGPEACRRLLPEDRLLSMGDDELVDAVVAAEAAVADGLGAGPGSAALKAGRLHEEVWRSEGLDAFARRPGADRALALDPGWRTATEEELQGGLPWAAPGDLIVAVSAPTMQAKPANARFVGGAGEVFTLAGAADHGYPTEAAETAGRYAQLWSLRVYLAPRHRRRAPEAEKVAADLLGPTG